MSFPTSNLSTYPGRLTIDEMKVAISAIRALSSLSLSPTTCVGWTNLGTFDESGNLDYDGEPCRCAAQAVWEFRHTKSLRAKALYRDKEAGSDALTTVYYNLTDLLRAMGHRGFLIRYADILAAVPFLETVIAAAEGRCIDQPKIASREESLVAV